MEKKTLIGLMVIVAIVATVIFAGCIEEKASGQTLTQVRIVDVDATTVGLSQIGIDMTIKNVGGTTAKNVIASVILVGNEHLDDVLNDPLLLRMYTEDEMLCLDREYLGDIESNQYVKAKLLINSDDMLEGWHAVKVATADNAEAVYY